MRDTLNVRRPVLAMIILLAIAGSASGAPSPETAPAPSPSASPWNGDFTLLRGAERCPASLSIKRTEEAPAPSRRRLCPANASPAGVTVMDGERVVLSFDLIGCEPAETNVGDPTANEIVESVFGVAAGRETLTKRRGTVSTLVRWDRRWTSSTTLSLDADGELRWLTNGELACVFHKR